MSHWETITRRQTYDIYNKGNAKNKIIAPRMSLSPFSNPCQEKNKYKSIFQEEYDEKFRNCEVVLFLTPCNAPISRFLEWYSGKHWAILFKFDNRDILHELVTSASWTQTGEIRKTWTDFKGQDRLLARKICIGSLVISPKKINDIANNHSLNDQNG